MAKRDFVTSGCLDLGLKALLTNKRSEEIKQDIHTDITFIPKNTFAQLAEAGKWSELIAVTEKVLSSAGASSEARVWWIRAHLRGQSLPVSLLLPPFASLCKHTAQRNEITGLRSELSELAVAMIDRMQAAEDREGMRELNDLVNRHDLFTSEVQRMLEDTGEAVLRSESGPRLEPKQSAGCESYNLQASRFSKTVVFAMFLLLGAGGLFMVAQGRTPVAQLNTLAVNDRIEDEIPFSSEFALPNPLKRVELSNLEALRYGIQEDQLVSSTHVSESTPAHSAPRDTEPSALADQTSSTDVTKRTIKKETINTSGPIEGSEFNEGKERERVIRPQLPRSDVFNRPIDGGVMHAPFDTRRMVVVSPSRVFRQATTSSVVLGQLLSGDKILVEGVYGKWARIRSRSGRTGFVPVEVLGEGVDFRAP